MTNKKRILLENRIQYLDQGDGSDFPGQDRGYRPANRTAIERRVMNLSLSVRAPSPLPDSSSNWNITAEEINVKQALAAIGQPHLMRMFQENFRELGLFAAQCLLSYSDFENRKSKANIKNTIDVLVSNNFIPIINENDTVAADEIQFGDNDKLASLTAALLEVDLMIIATNTFGIYTKASLENGHPKTIDSVADIDGLIEEISQGKSTHGTGGMASKIEAATIAQNAGIETWIVNGLKDNFVVDAFESRVRHTRVKRKFPNPEN